MNNVNNFFKKIIEAISLSESLEGDIIDAVEQVVGIRIKKDQISIKDKTVIFNTHPAVKQEIFLKKENILGLINNKTQRIINVR